MFRGNSGSAPKEYRKHPERWAVWSQVRASAADGSIWVGLCVLLRVGPNVHSGFLLCFFGLACFVAAVVFCLFVCFFSYLMVLCGCLVVKLCPTHWDPTNCSIPGFPALHCLLEFAQTHVHWLSDAIQPSHPLSPPSPPVFNPSQPQSLFQWVSFSHQVAKVLELQHQSFWWIFRVDFL